ncbi:alpha/beta hydrolase [Aureispira anguillae]|uniref:Alpha/beta hydrolase n=1 Tax=Aureispira anguillae TaxID=2864201 RepID=A0A915YAE7_9BACT|nr:alpha/beta hydrolase [Aureispira anguillae]BDS09527.1 alpha/beta hydrolase [Aureispira anguillae]
MPSLSARLVFLVLKIKGVKKIFSQNPIPYKKLRKDDIKIPSKRILSGNSSKQFKVLDTTITLIKPKNIKKTDFLILYCPGGAFVSGPNLLSWEGISKLVKQTKITAWMLDYPKAPEATIRQTTKNIQAVYTEALKTYAAANIILMGDSAGGNLVLTLTQYLIQNALPLPNRLIAISPVLDSSLSNAAIDAIDPLDPMLSKQGVLSAKQMSRGDLAAKDPLISPLYGSFKGFPPVHLFMGEKDILFPDQQLGCEKMSNEGVDLEVVVGVGMPHIWPFLPVMKEAKIALNQIAKIITIHTH